MSFLEKLEEKGKDVWIRHVIVPGINDTIEDIEKLKELTKGYKCIKNIELLPYKNLCLEKYENMKIDFPLKETPPLSKEKLNELNSLL